MRGRGVLTAQTARYTKSRKENGSRKERLGDTRL